jgi:hypothetical protein
VLLGLGVCIPKERKAMKNKLNLITLLLTILFSFTVTSVVWAECEVTIFPDATLIRPGEKLTFTAETTCDGSIQPDPDPKPPDEGDILGWCTRDLCLVNSTLRNECVDFMTTCLTAADTPEELEQCAVAGLLICSEVEAELAAIPNYTWEISEGTCTGSSIGPDTGIYTTGAGDNFCADTVMVTDTANGGITATATANVAFFDPSVNIYGPATLGPPCPASATYTAETTLDGDPLSGTYTWELDGETAGTGDSIEVTCTEAGTKTLVVADFAVGGWVDSINIECLCPGDVIEATFSGCGTPLIPWFGVVEIETGFFEFGRMGIVEYDSPLVFKLPKLHNRRGPSITQFVILLPSILFPAWDYPARVEVAVYGFYIYGFSDTIEIPACGQ